MIRKNLISALAVTALAAGLSCLPALLPARADLGVFESIGKEQQQERAELEDMRNEVSDIKKTMSEAASAMNKAQAQINQPQVKEFHLIAKETQWEILPGTFVPALAYNERVPGPVMRVQEGDAVSIILHNQLKVSTSLYFHGLTLPHGVAGLPRKQAGLLAPGDTFAYQFIANRAGTIWYHPQVIHADQVFSGLCGVLVVEPRSSTLAYTRDYVMVIQQWQAKAADSGQAAPKPKKNGSTTGAASGGSGSTGNTTGGVTTTNSTPPKPAAPPPPVTYYTVNGKSAPGIAPIEVKKGDRVRLRVVNAAQQPCPLYLTGHRFEIMATNGSEPGDINPRRDILTIAPGDRYDLEFVADNPGVWSLSSLMVEQTSNQGKFPGGVACIVRYVMGK